MNIMIKCVPRLGFSSLRPLGNVQRNGFRFENQSITWTFEEFDVTSTPLPLESLECLRLRIAGSRLEGRGQAPYAARPLKH